ncbi:SUMF1/EgtB/PvdO family nonheme iron enzyme [Aquabacterium sp. J223]|uniref:SUMF1/EgtB/PvdO family nonheme iron enzyme n=1 Tax=Aquabacterium sp. J223 TaxID=2898431 RepID=UPI0021ADD525|nr:SUMF1/EgtB/PvdO family nonheme iron enzyme [Aquabacterium sp. J223]UUX95507.1 SUMF1/EgtB/PvdO family nonheme iron enzyme [Aquabacterium sp. J223]
MPRATSRNGGPAGLLVQQAGRLLQLSPRGAACHVSAHEADAWCRWAGRRLPTGAEWEAAALAFGGRGFAFGDVWEWTLGTAGPYPGHRPSAAPVLGALPGERERALRGGSAQTVPRQRHPRVRAFALPSHDGMFSGFRSCAL